MFPSRLAEAQKALEGGSYCAAFTANTELRDFCVHGLGFAHELKSVVEEADRGGRVFVGVAAFTPSGPRTVLTESLDAEAIASLTSLYAAHVQAVLTRTLQQLSGTTGRLQHNEA